MFLNCNLSVSWLEFKGYCFHCKDPLCQFHILLQENGHRNDRKEIDDLKQCHKSLKVHIELDCIAVTLFVIGLCMRLYHLEEPKSIV